MGFGFSFLNLFTANSGFFSSSSISWFSLSGLFPDLEGEVVGEQILSLVFWLVCSVERIGRGGFSITSRCDREIGILAYFGVLFRSSPPKPAMAAGACLGVFSIALV